MPLASRARCPRTERDDVLGRVERVSELGQVLGAVRARLPARDGGYIKCKEAGTVEQRLGSRAAS
jgi:hypothetical protein